MNISLINNSADNRRQFTVAQLLILVALVSIPLVCFLNYHSKVANTNSGYVTPMMNASGFSLLWLGAGVLTACSAFTYLCYRRQVIGAGLYMVLVFAPLAFIMSGYVAPDRTINPAVTKNTKAMSLVIVATTQFVTNNNSQWPESWDDLRPLMPNDEFETISSRVDFDFDADPHLLATQEWHEFTGIVPHKPFLNRYRDELVILLEQMNRQPKTSTGGKNGR